MPHTESMTLAPPRAALRPPQTEPPLAAADARAATQSWLALLMRETGLDPTKMAKRIGVAQTTIARAMYTNSAYKPASRETLLKLQSAFGREVPPAVLRAAPPGRARRGHLPLDVLPTIPAAATPGRDIPLKATYLASHGPLFWLNHQAYDFAPRPAGIVAASKVFAIRAPDDSMEPWRRPGQLVFLDPIRAPGTGDHVVLELHAKAEPDAPPVHLLCRLGQPGHATRAPEAWCHNPPGPVPLDEFVITARWRVLEMDELLGA